MIKLIFNLFSTQLLQSDKVCNVLSLSGGGSLGITEISILEDIYQGEQYDLITGISVGALNALYLSHYKNNFKDGINDMKDVWFSMTDKDVYEYGVFNPFYKWSFYDTTPLNNTISKIISSLDNKETIQTLIGATNLNYGKLDIFDIHTENKASQQDILLASSAVPIAFPPVNMNGNIYVDGGLITNEIIYNIKKYINCDYYNITFLDTTNPYKEKHNINSIGDYISDVIGLLLNNFDVDIMKKKKCDNVNGQINVYYLDKQHNISILDFNRVRELYDYGKTYKYKKFDYCD